LILFIISCDYGSSLIIKNNSNIKLLIEINTTFDTNIKYLTTYENGETYGRIDWKSIYPERVGGFTLLITPFELDIDNDIKIISLLGQIINEFEYGSVKSKDDIKKTIDEIFLEINIYYEDENEKILLYDKSYFLNEDIIEIREQRFPTGKKGLYDIILHINNHEVLEN